MRRFIELAPFLGALFLALACGYLFGRLVTERRSLTDLPVSVRDAGRPPVPTVRLDGVFDGQVRGTMIGEARLFLGGKQVLPDAGGTILTPAGPLLTNTVRIAVPEGMRFVASKRGQKYYPVGSASATALSPAHRVYFATEEEAQAAGYRK